MATIVPLRSAASALLVSALLCGCSFAFVDGPPKVHKQLPYFECSSSNAWPTIDLVLGGIYGIESAAFFSGSASASNPNAGGAVIAGMAALFIASAVSGYEKTSSCRDAKDDLMKRLYLQPGGSGFGPESGFAPKQQPSYDPWLAPRPGAFTRPHAPSTTSPAGNESPDKASPARPNEEEKP
jgi:hypothetical protein